VNSSASATTGIPVGIVGPMWWAPRVCGSSELVNWAKAMLRGKAGQNIEISRAYRSLLILALAAARVVTHCLLYLIIHLT